jgi:hypothetical protein
MPVQYSTGRALAVKAELARKACVGAASNRPKWFGNVVHKTTG